MGLLILGNLALITTTTVTVSITITVTVTVAVISLTQQLHTAQYFDTMSGTVLTLALNLGKLHNQTQTMEHSQLDFIATRVANDFFHAFSNFISGKNILSTILSCTAVGALGLFSCLPFPSPSGADSSPSDHLLCSAPHNHHIFLAG